MKKYFFITLALLVILPCAILFAACGEPEPTTTVSEINVQKLEKVYFLGEELNYDDTSIIVKKRDGTEQTMKLTENMVEDFDTSTAGDKQLKITYLDKTISYDYKVINVLGTRLVATKEIVGSTNSVVHTYDEYPLDITFRKDFTCDVNKFINGFLETTICMYQTRANGRIIITNIDDPSDQIVLDRNGTSYNTTWRVDYNENYGFGEGTQFYTTLEEYQEKGVELERSEVTNINPLFFLNEELNLENAKIVHYYSDNTTVTVDITEDMVVLFSSTTPGAGYLVVEDEISSVVVDIYVLPFKTAHLVNTKIVDLVGEEEQIVNTTTPENRMEIVLNKDLTCQIKNIENGSATTTSSTWTPLDGDTFAINFSTNDQRMIIVRDNEVLIKSSNEQGSQRYLVFEYAE